MTANTLALLLNGLTLALALGLLILVLWQDSRSEANQLFALFLLMVMVWSSGSLLGRVAALTGASPDVLRTGVRLLDIGFVGASFSLYVYSAIVTGSRRRSFRRIGLVGLAAIILYQGILSFFTDSTARVEITPERNLAYEIGRFSWWLYFLLYGATMALVWRNRQKIRSQMLFSGILIYVLGQLIGLLSPRLRELGFPEDVSAVAALVMTFAIVRQQIMQPLLGRAKQLEAVRDVGLAISSRLRLDETLSAIAAQAVGLLDADAAGIFLRRGDTFRLAAVFNLPAQFVGIELSGGEGIVGTVAVERRARRVDRYGRDWLGVDDLPLARETFGAVLCVPLLFGDEVVGVLLVIHGRQGKLFDEEDSRLLELLGPQAAVAITNSRLFEAERQLSRDLASAKNQLEAVLTSTENPVLAVNRQFRIVFANPAASKLLQADTDPVGWRVTDFVPRHFLPGDVRAVLRDLREKRVHVYELETLGRVYLAHVASLGRPRAQGWVVVLNDVTQLKELDRLKSQMIQMTSHDLKNPLQAAMSYLELLQEDAVGAFSQDMWDYVNAIETQLIRMFQLINGILDLERIEGGGMKKEICNINEIISRTVYAMKKEADINDIDITLEMEKDMVEVIGDVQQLRQAFSNLLDNAIKFTLPGGCVRVETRRDDTGVWIRMQDTGVGIPEDELEHIFERFFRGRAHRDSHATGTGLGLALVKTVVDRHRGTINVSSHPGQGTTVDIVLPAGNLSEA